MTADELRVVVAGNITRYRKQSGMTQLMLADKLSYSDKSVSKWERGDSIPDTYTMLRLAELFGVSVDELLGNKITDGTVKTNSSAKKKKHHLITAMSVILVWLTASVVYVALELFEIINFKCELVFMYAIPVSFIVFLVLSCVWYGYLQRAISVSGIVWTTALSIYLTFSLKSVSYIFISAAILQILTVLWFVLLSHQKRKEKQI